MRARVRVTGRVQGVGFRAGTRAAAAEHDARGWVRNCDDGSVEAVFEGSQSAVESMIEWCRDGSPDAAVSDVSVTREAPEGVDGFDVRWSA